MFAHLIFMAQRVYVITFVHYKWGAQKTKQLDGTIGRLFFRILLRFTFYYFFFLLRLNNQVLLTHWKYACYQKSSLREFARNCSTLPLTNIYRTLSHFAFDVIPSYLLFFLSSIRNVLWDIRSRDLNYSGDSENKSPHHSVFSLYSLP